MKKLFLLLALFGVLAVGCESPTDNVTPDVNHTFVTDSEGDYVVDAEGGEIVVAITTDIEYDVVIPTDAQSWLSVADTRAETRMEKLKFIVAPNSGTEERSAMVELVDNDYNTLEIISITQTVKTQASANKEIWYTTTNGNTLLPYDSDASVFGAILVSNTYSNGRGVLVFDDEVTSIGDCAFTNCRTLASITIPESVTYIGRESFGGCSNLTSITIPENVTSLGYYAFVYCNRLSEFKGKFASDNGRCLIVSGILAAFAPAGIKEYTIPTSVTKIGVGVFYGCDNLKNITIPKSVTKILPSAFDGYTGSLVVNCNLPSVSSFLDSAFNQGEFTSITIGDSVTTIGDYAFWGCSSQCITIPDSVTTIGTDAFQSCTGKLIVNCNIPDTSFKFADFTSVTIGNNVTTIGDSAFYACSSLTSVTIPDSVTTIGGHAFYNCSSLTSVTIGDSVTTIGGSAFYNCGSLTSVYCKAVTPPTGGNDMFSYYNDYTSTIKPIDCTIYVPTESVEAYMSASGWSEYADAIVGYNF